MMSTDEKSTAIIKKLLEICNNFAGLDPMGPVVQIGPDWGYNALTVYIGDTHSHVGFHGGSFEQMIDSMHALLCDGKGLSWAPKVH